MADNPHLNQDTPSGPPAPVSTSTPRVVNTAPVSNPPNVQQERSDREGKHWCLLYCFIRLIFSISAPALALPVNQPYQSARSAQVASFVVPPPSYQPFLGFSTLAPSATTLNTSHANQERRRHAEAVLPRSATAGLAPRRTRGPAQSRPTLPGARKLKRPSIDDCIVDGSDPAKVRAHCLVYPAPVCTVCSIAMSCLLISISQDPEGSYQDHILYRMLHGDFVNHLQEQHLSYRYDLDLDSSVNDLLSRVVTDMAASPAKFIFQVARRTSRSTLITTLQVLSVVDRGRPHKKHGVRLRVEPHTEETKISDLAFDGNRYATEASIRNGEFIIRLGAFPRRFLSVNRADLLS